MIRRPDTRSAIRILTVAAAMLPIPGAAQSSGPFDHEPFNRLLRTHVTETGLVDYEAFAESRDFPAYLDALAAADVASLPRAEQLALWINAYNAYTIQLINEHGERRSIRSINKTLGIFGGSGAWKERMARVGGRKYTLDEIEHEVIRDEFKEPRIHFALVCAALGCPPLRQEAYAGKSIEAQLDDQARRFLADASKNRGETTSETVYLSPIFDWYRKDFPAGPGPFGRYLASYLQAGPLRTLLESGNFEVEYTDYDWDLNIQR